MSKKTKTVIWLVPILFLIMSIAFLAPSPKPDINLKQKTFSKLKKIRNKKKQAIVEYFNNIQNCVGRIENDEQMIAFFSRIISNGYHADQSLEYEIDKYAITHYGDFYDILFVDKKGMIFHSLRKETDYRHNIFKKPLSLTKLSESMKKNHRKSFVEYEFYPPSAEPAAFFAVPISISGRPKGWFVLQCAINKVNTILVDRKNLGRTGEVYLVNKEKLMLSDSRFINDSTILKLKVDTNAVKKALQKDIGESIIKDYRGIIVFSTFERFEVFGASWIIITEMDEDEAVTEVYKEHKEYFNTEICRFLKKNRPSKTNDIPNNHSLKTKRIDINEFYRADAGEKIETHGVATCTAAAIIFKDKFCYLSHISPTDAIYSDRNSFDFLSKPKRNSFFGELLKRVKYFDLYPYELKYLKFVIIAPHNGSFSNMVDIMLDNGIELSNIKFMYNPSAICANVSVGISQPSTMVKWVSDRSETLEYSSGVEDLGSILKKIM